MALDPNLWDTEYPIVNGEAVSEDEFADFEKQHQVRLPEFLKEMYRIQNGGGLIDLEGVEILLPIKKQENCWLPPMGSVEQSAKDGTFFFYDEDLEEIRAQAGDPKRMIYIGMAYGGAHKIVLNYNKTNTEGDPEVICINFDGVVEAGFLAPTFRNWMEQLTDNETELVLDWDEYKQYQVLYQSAETLALESGAIAQRETALCAYGKRDLLLFIRILEDDRMTQIERCLIPKGAEPGRLDKSWTIANSNGSYSLRLQPIENDSIERIHCERRINDQWKVERTCGPRVCTVDSKDQQVLKDLAQKLHAAGYTKSFY